MDRVLVAAIRAIERGPTGAVIFESRDCASLERSRVSVVKLMWCQLLVTVDELESQYASTELEARQQVAYVMRARVLSRAGVSA